MQIARPVDGFKLTISPTVEALILSKISADPRIDRFWGDIIEHLKMVGHVAGVSEPRLGKACRVFVTGPDPISGQPKFVVGYKVLGGSLSVRVLHISD